jgi:hypothetical protein
LVQGFPATGDAAVAYVIDDNPSKKATNTAVMDLCMK